MPAPTVTPDVPKTEEWTDTLTRLLPPWRVMLYNDDYNSMEHVAHALLVTVPSLTPEQAVEIMLEAHLTGVALVTTAPKERAEFYRERLEAFGLTSTIEPDE